MVKTILSKRVLTLKSVLEKEEKDTVEASMNEIVELRELMLEIDSKVFPCIFHVVFMSPLDGGY